MAIIKTSKKVRTLSGLRKVRSKGGNKMMMWLHHVKEIAINDF